MSDLGLGGSVALVTGAAVGIGRAICETLVREGATVVGVDVIAAAGIALCDVTDGVQVEELVAGVVREHGRIDVLVHAAGVTHDGMLWKLSDEAWRDVLSVNLDAAFLLLRATAPHLRRSSRASAVLISSINGERGKRGQANYCASKAGLIGLARAAARDLGRDGGRVNVVAPGFIATAMTETLGQEVTAQALSETVLGRLGHPTDVAGAVLFLCSDLARHMTGQVLRVDGGQLMA